MSEKEEKSTLAYPEQVHSILGEKDIQEMMHNDVPISGNELDNIQRRLESDAGIPTTEHIKHVLEHSTLQEASLIAQDLIDNALTRVFEDEPDFEAITLENLTSFQGRNVPSEIFSYGSHEPKIAFKYVEHEQTTSTAGVGRRFRRLLGRDNAQQTDEKVVVPDEALIVVSLNNSNRADVEKQDQLKQQIRELSARFQRQYSLDGEVGLGDYNVPTDGSVPTIMEMPGTADLARIRLLQSELSALESSMKEKTTVVVCLAKIDPTTKKPVRDRNGRMHAMATVMSEKEYRQGIANPTDPMGAVLRGEATSKDYKRRYAEQNRESYMSAWRAHDEAVLDWREVQEDEPEKPTYEDPVEIAMAKHDRKLRGEPEPPRPEPSDAQLHNEELTKWERSREKLLDQVEARYIIALEEVAKRNEQIIEETESFVADLNSKSREINPNVHLGTEIENEIRALMQDRLALSREERNDLIQRIMNQYKYHRDTWGAYDKEEIYRSIHELERQYFLKRLNSLPADQKEHYIFNRRVRLFGERIADNDVTSLEAGLAKIRTRDDIEKFMSSVRTDITLIFDDEAPEVIEAYLRSRAEFALSEHQAEEEARERRAATSPRRVNNNTAVGRNGAGQNRNNAGGPGNAGSGNGQRPQRGNGGRRRRS